MRRPGLGNGQGTGIPLSDIASGYREAVAAFDGELRFHPQDLKSMYYRAQAFEKSGAAGEASAAYRAALDLVHADLIQRLRETDPSPYIKILSLTRGAS